MLSAQRPAGAEPSADEAGRTRWSIGIFTGRSPLHLGPAPRVRNPVLEWRHVSDVNADFVADPFLVREGGRWLMFFEVMNRDRGKGEIGLAESGDGLRWRYRQIVLREPFHLSYPFVFRWRSGYYMVPETHEAGRLFLYRSIDFPLAWERARPLLDFPCVDASPFRRGGRWWMYLCATPHAHDSLRLYSAARLGGPWREHPASPLVENDATSARPAGRPLLWRRHLFRFAQVCHPDYGRRVRAFEVTELTGSRYAEREIEASPVLVPAGRGWRCVGMHHLDLHAVAGGWMAGVDGLGVARSAR